MRILVLGTSSDAGKTVTSAIICRYLAKNGMDPAPFKASNLSLNSYATVDGGEIGIGQAFQAWACGLEPESDMNPVLLKPSGNGRTQLVLGGKPFMDISSQCSFDRDAARHQIAESFERLSERHGSVVCEGSGSPAELNLMEKDLANIGMMRQFGIPSVLVGDIERGGVFAAIYGTWKLIPDDVRHLMKGFIINRFRGDPSILSSGIDEIERLTGMRCLGVLPFMNLRFPEEDSLSVSGGELSGDNPKEAFIGNLDRILEAAEDSGFDFEALLEMMKERSSAGCDPHRTDLRPVLRDGVHGNRPPGNDEEERIGNLTAGTDDVLYRPPGIRIQIPLRHMYDDRHQMDLCPSRQASVINSCPRDADMNRFIPKDGARNINYILHFPEDDTPIRPRRDL